MKNVLGLLTMAALWCSLVSLGLAEDSAATKLPDQKEVKAKKDASATANIPAEIHRTIAALIDAQAAEEPDQAKINRLTKKLQRLRESQQAQAPAAVGVQPAGSAGPWAGPGMGWGRGAGWNGQGRGMAAGRGMGLGPGTGRGWGAGAGMGRGAGGGRGFGLGAGMGFRAGGGVLVDQDGDGICDHYELRHGLHP